MKQIIQLIAATAMVGGILGSAHASNTRFEIPMYDEHLHNRTIHLKDEIHRNYPGVNLRNVGIDKVVLFAKTRHGDGTAELLIDGRTQDRREVGGRPADFDNPAQYTFDRVELHSRTRNDGPWHLKLNGNFVVRRIVVTTQGDGSGYPYPYWTNLRGEVEAPKYNYGIEAFYPYAQTLSAIRIVGTKGEIHVEDAYLRYDNGQVRYLSELVGYLEENQARVAVLNQRYVREIVIKATSTNLSGSRGRYLIQVAD